jgi:hypothetical protein
MAERLMAGPSRAIVRTARWWGGTRRLACVLAFVGLALAAAGSPGRAADRQFLFAEGLTFVFDEQDRALAERLWPLMIADRRDIMERLGLHPEGALRVVLAPTREAFEQALGGFTPEALGVYFPASRTVVLRSPRTLPGGQWDLRGVTRHELAHGILDLAIGQPIPRWLNEGLAILFADELSFLDDSRLTLLAWRDQLIPLALLMGSFPSAEHALDTAYTQAASFARYLLRRDGLEGIRRLLAHMAQGEEPAGAFAMAYGEPLSALERAWQQRLSERFSWFALVTPLSVLGAVGAPLVIVGYLRRRIEARRRLRDWEDEGEPPTGLPVPSRPSAAPQRGVKSWRRPAPPSS